MIRLKPTDRKTARLIRKFWNARLNMAEIPFLKKGLGMARNASTQLALHGTVRSGKEASQLIQYTILLTI